MCNQIAKLILKENAREDETVEFKISHLFQLMVIESDVHKYVISNYNSIGP